MLSRPKVAVDVDSTLYDFMPPMRQAFLDLALERGDKESYFRGGYQSWVEWRSPTDVCGLDAFVEALSRVHSDDVILSRQPFDHAVEVTTEIAEDYDVIYVTQREEKCYEPTRQWLMINGFPAGDLVLTGSDKQAALADCQYLIDDRPKTLVEFVYDRAWAVPQYQLGYGPRKAFGLLYEYNRALTDVPGIFLAPTWWGLKFYLIEKGVLSGRRSTASLA